MTLTHTSFTVTQLETPEAYIIIILSSKVKLFTSKTIEDNIGYHRPNARISFLNWNILMFSFVGWKFFNNLFVLYFFYSNFIKVLTESNQFLMNVYFLFLSRRIFEEMDITHDKVDLNVNRSQSLSTSIEWQLIQTLFCWAERRSSQIL